MSNDVKQCKNNDNDNDNENESGNGNENCSLSNVRTKAKKSTWLLNPKRKRKIRFLILFCLYGPTTNRNAGPASMVPSEKKAPPPNKN